MRKARNDERQKIKEFSRKKPLLAKTFTLVYELVELDKVQVVNPHNTLVQYKIYPGFCVRDLCHALAKAILEALKTNGGSQNFISLFLQRPLHNSSLSITEEYTLLSNLLNDKNCGEYEQLFLQEENGTTKTQGSVCLTTEAQEARIVLAKSLRGFQLIKYFIPAHIENPKYSLSNLMTDLGYIFGCAKNLGQAADLHLIWMEFSQRGKIGGALSENFIRYLDGLSQDILACNLRTIAKAFGRLVTFVEVYPQLEKELFSLPVLGVSSGEILTDNEKPSRITDIPSLESFLTNSNSAGIRTTLSPNTNHTPAKNYSATRKFDSISNEREAEILEALEAKNIEARIPNEETLKNTEEAIQFLVGFIRKGAPANTNESDPLMEKVKKAKHLLMLLKRYRATENRPIADHDNSPTRSSLEAKP